MVHYVPMKNPSSVTLFKLKVKCWCYRDCISWRWPWLMWNMTWGKWISAQCGEIICEMLPLYQSLFSRAHMPKYVQTHTHTLGSECVCVWICMSLYDRVRIYASLSWGYWSWEQLAETAAANRNKQLNVRLCWMFRGSVFPSDHTGIVLLQSQNPNPWFLHSYISNVILS